MTLNETKKLSKHICRLLKVSEINFPIGRTPKGNLGITFNENNDDFEMMLDSVPLSTKNSLEDENNIELKAMLEKYLFDSELIFSSGTPTLSVKNDITGTGTGLTTVSHAKPATNGKKAKTNT